MRQLLGVGALLLWLSGCAGVSRPPPVEVIRHPFAGRGAVLAAAAGMETPDDWLCEPGCWHGDRWCLRCWPERRTKVRGVWIAAETRYTLCLGIDRPEGWL
jgi:hypothetical protein